MYEEVFRVDLSHDGFCFQNENEVQSIAGTKTMLIPVNPNGEKPNLVVRHGDVFTLNGSHAAYLKNLIIKGEAPNFKIHRIPNVLDLELEVDGTTVYATWNPDSRYQTEVQYRYDDGEWTTLPLVAAGIGER